MIRGSYVVYRISFLLLLAALLLPFTLRGDTAEYNVEFRDADIKSAVRILAKMSDQNVVVPNGLQGTVTASFDNIDLKSALTAILKTQGYGSITENDVLQILSNEQLEKLGEDLEAHAYNLKYAKAETILPSIQSLVSGRGSAIADNRTNTLYVRDTKSAIGNITGLVANIDKKGQQVLIEAKMIEASVEFIRSVGIQWGVTKTGGKIQFGGVTAVGTDDQGRALMFNAPATGLRSSPPTSGVGLIVGSFKGIVTDAQLTAAEQTGDINVLARPTIATMNNQPASIRSGTKFYVKTTGDFNIGGSSTSQSNLQEIDTGIQLKVTPQISAEGNISLEIEATQSEADFTQAIDGVPAVIDKSAVTTVRLKDNETTIIGGLFHMKDALGVEGVPGLMKVPILGNLFKSKTKNKSRRELLIFLTPKIIESAVAELPHFAEPDSIYNPNPPVNNGKRATRNRKFR